MEPSVNCQLTFSKPPVPNFIFQKKIVSKILIPITIPKLGPVLNPVPILEQDPK